MVNLLGKLEVKLTMVLMDLQTKTKTPLMIEKTFIGIRSDYEKNHPAHALVLVYHAQSKVRKPLDVESAAQLKRAISMIKIACQLMADNRIPYPIHLAKAQLLQATWLAELARREKNIRTKDDMFCRAERLVRYALSSKMLVDPDLVMEAKAVHKLCLDGMINKAPLASTAAA